MKLNELKSELKEKQMNYIFLVDNFGNAIEKEILLKEISALKKCISACEEILNSQQIQNEEQGRNSELYGDSKQVTAGKPSRLMGIKPDNKTADTPTLINKKYPYFYHIGDEIIDSWLDKANERIKQALSNRNKEILEVINNEIQKQNLIYEEMKDKRTTRMKNSGANNWGMIEAKNRKEHYEELKDCIHSLMAKHLTCNEEIGVQFPVDTSKQQLTNSEGKE